jgi:hypothetical protein
MVNSMKANFDLISNKAKAIKSFQMDQNTLVSLRRDLKTGRVFSNGQTVRFMKGSS